MCYLIVQKCGSDPRNRLYNGTCYYFEDKHQLTFTDANQYCISTGRGYLASIWSTAEDKFIYSQVCRKIIIDVFNTVVKHLISCYR